MALTFGTGPLAPHPAGSFASVQDAPVGRLTHCSLAATEMTTEGR